jgi:hypothetical protein
MASGAPVVRPALTPETISAWSRSIFVDLAPRP